MWGMSEIDNKFIKRTEDLLDLYEKAFESNVPVVCPDEGPVQLQAEIRSSTAALSGTSCGFKNTAR